MPLHRWPVPGASIQRPYTDFLVWRDATETSPRRLHGGIDLHSGRIMQGFSRSGLVIAAAPGRVVLSTTETSYNPGLLVFAGRALLDGVETILYLVYGHLSPATVRRWPVGKSCVAGEHLGFCANQAEIAAGAATNKTNPEMGPHLHFEVRLTLFGQSDANKPKFYFDPVSFLQYGKLIKGRVYRGLYPVEGW